MSDRKQEDKIISGDVRKAIEVVQLLQVWIDSRHGPETDIYAVLQYSLYKLSIMVGEFCVYDDQRDSWPLSLEACKKEYKRIIRKRMAIVLD